MRGTPANSSRKIMVSPLMGGVLFSTTAERQSVAGGDVAAIGTVIDVRFFNVVEDGHAG